MTSAKVFLVAIVCIAVAGREKVHGDVGLSTPIEVKSVVLTNVLQTTPSEIFGMSLNERRELCEKEAYKVAENLGTLTLPSSDSNYYVPAAQLYYVKGDTSLSTPALRCPTFPALYLFEYLSPSQVTYTYTVKMHNPYMHYGLEFESALSAEEIDPSKKDKKDKQKDEVEDEEKSEKKTKKEEDKDKLSKEKVEEEDEDKEKQKEKKDKEEEENEEKTSKKEDKKKEKPKEKKDKHKKKEKLGPQEQHLLRKMVNVDAEQRWFLCHKARMFIHYDVDPRTYTGNHDYKIYKFSYSAGPSEMAVAFQCFTVPKIYIRASRSGAKDAFMISLIEDASMESRRQTRAYKMLPVF